MLRIPAPDSREVCQNRQLLTVMLAEWGASAIAASSAAEAIEILAQSQPDILVSDIGIG